MSWFLYWLRQQINEERDAQVAAGAALLLFAFFACSNLVDHGWEIVQDRPTRTTLSPSQVREQRQAEETVLEVCALWWDDLIDLSDGNTQVCVDTA